MSDDELEAIRRKKLAQYQQRATDEQRQVQAEKDIEAQKQALLRQILSPEARQRLTNLKMIKQDFTDNLEMQLIQLAQMEKSLYPYRMPN
jgi:programmed cell death protein 5